MSLSKLSESSTEVVAWLVIQSLSSTRRSPMSTHNTVEARINRLGFI
jgi:hypothetical protein